MTEHIRSKGTTLLPEERAQKIAETITADGSATVGALAARFGVTHVTIRRDLKRLHEAGVIHRTHGGAVRRGRATDGSRSRASRSPADLDVRATDALVLPPLRHRAAHALRARAMRTGTPLLAESAPHTGAVYVGPDDRAAARTLGAWTADHLPAWITVPVVLDLTLDLPNTRDRSTGFLEGFRSTLGRDPQVISAIALGLFGQAHQVATDALRLHPDINVIFAVNDATILGALQAYRDLDLSPDRIVAVNVGCEGTTLLDELASRGPLKASLALFPDIVGSSLVDTAARIWSGADVGTRETTPHRIVTPDTLQELYRRIDDDWVHVAGASMTRPLEPAAAAAARGRRISLIVQYPTHEWYRNLARAMNERASQLEATFEAIDVNEDLDAEIAELRRLIGEHAASCVADGETLVLEAGTATASLARGLHGRQNLTVITNSADVFRELADDPNTDLVVVGGVFDRRSGAFVGAGARRFLADVRADKAFVVGDGLSAAFGLSARTSEEAEMRQAMMRTARETVVLADHTSIGSDARVRVADVDDIDTLITDAAVASEETFRFAQHGIRIVVAGQSTGPRAAGSTHTGQVPPGNRELVP